MHHRCIGSHAPHFQLTPLEDNARREQADVHLHDALARLDHQFDGTLLYGDMQPAGAADVGDEHPARDEDAFIAQMARQSAHWVERYAAQLRPAAAFSAAFVFGLEQPIEDARDNEGTAIAILERYGQ